MGQRFIDAFYTYFQFSGMVFEHFLKTETLRAKTTPIGDQGDWEFSFFMDDLIGAAISFETMFNFLHWYYFLHASFGFVYLAPYKTFVFTD